MGRKKKKARKQKKTSVSKRSAKKSVLANKPLSDIGRAFKKAVGYHQSGQFQQAEDIYERILKADPNHSDTLHLSGVLAHQMKQSDRAVDLINRAIRISPERLIYHNNLGIVFQERGDLDRAISCYQRALEINPDSADTYNYMGFALQDQRKLDEAISCYQKAVQLNPDHVEAFNNAGTALKENGNINEAISCYQEAIRRKPDYAQAYNNLGAALKDENRLDEALSCYQKSLELSPNYVEAHNNMGTLLRDSGKHDQAMACHQKALEIRPDDAEAFGNMGLTLKDLGRINEALSCYQKSLQLKPDNAATWLNLGNALQDQGKPDEAISCYQKALKIRPDHAVAYNNMRNAYIYQGKVAEAIACCEKSLQIRPDPGIEVRKAMMLPVIYESREQIQSYRQRLVQEVGSLRNRGITLEDPNTQVGSTNFYLAYHGLDDKDIQQQIASFYLHACPDLAWEPKMSPPARNRFPIRVGIVSMHLHNLNQQTIGKLTRGIIRNLSREKFSVTLFRFPGGENSLTQSINEGADEVIDLPANLSPAREIIARHSPDILFYPDIGMDSLTYFLAFSRLAPVQCVTWGHPVTTGIPNMDYFISSEHLEPPAAHAHYSEQLVLLKRLPVFYYPPEVPEPVLPRDAFGLPLDRNLYICPQAPFKFHPDFDLALGTILRRDPRGQVILIEGHAFEHWAKLLLDRFSKTFPDVIDRVRFLKAMPTEKFLSLLRVADALIEPPYFGGGNTTYESFACGVPIVTWPGPFMRGRVTLGCYRQMGVMDCVAKDPQSYVDIALRLANDTVWRESVKAKVRANAHAIFEDMEAIRELERFFENAVDV